VIAFKTTLKEPALRDAGSDWILNNCTDIRLTSAYKGLTLTLLL
jgi:hypothetical protein